jgi:molecular chaperone DnaK
VTIQAGTNMDEKEVDRLVKEAEANRESDKLKKESIEARNHADSAIYQAEKTLKDNEGKYDAKDGEDAKVKIEELKKVLEPSDASKADIDAKLNPLQEIMMKIGQAIYAQGTTDAETANDKKNDDGTVDAEVEEK